MVMRPRILLHTSKQHANKNTSPRQGIITCYIGDPTNINVELLFRDLFALRDRFKELGMVIKNGEVYLPDLEGHDV
jgi:hypothetical protein